MVSLKSQDDVYFHVSYHHLKQIAKLLIFASSGIILCLCPTNERLRYIVTSSLIG